MVFPKIGVGPKMDGENNGKPYLLMDDLGGKPTIFGNIHINVCNIFKSHKIHGTALITCVQ